MVVDEAGVDGEQPHEQQDVAAGHQCPPHLPHSGASLDADQ